MEGEKEYQRAALTAADTVEERNLVNNIINKYISWNVLLFLRQIGLVLWIIGYIFIKQFKFDPPTPGTGKTPRKWSPEYHGPFVKILDFTSIFLLFSLSTVQHSNKQTR
jgi:hypothetical protein